MRTLYKITDVLIRVGIIALLFTLVLWFGKGLGL